MEILNSYEEIQNQQFLEDLLNDTEYFVQNQQNGILVVKSILNILTDKVFEFFDDKVYLQQMPKFLSQQINQQIYFHFGQEQINKNIDEGYLEDQFYNIPEQPIKDNVLSFQVQKISKNDVFQPNVEKIEKQISDTFNNNQYSIMKNSDIIYKPIPLNIQEKTDDQFFQELRHQKIQRDLFVKNNLQEVDEQKKKNKNQVKNNLYAQDLKDRKFTYDYDGNLIIINKKEQQKQAQSIKIKISQEQNQLQDQIKIKILDKKKQQNIQQQYENLDNYDIYQKQFELFEPQKGVTINLQSGESKQGQEAKINFIEQINEKELTVNSNLKLTKKEYKNLNIIRNISDKHYQIQDSFDILSGIQKNETSVQTERKINQSVSKISSKIANSLQVFDQKQYEMLLKSSQDVQNKISKNYKMIDDICLNYSKIDQFNENYIKNNKLINNNKTQRPNYQLPIQRLVVHKNKKINKTIPVKCAKYPRDAYKEESMALLRNQKSFLSHLQNSFASKEHDRYNFSIFSSQILNN